MNVAETQLAGSLVRVLRPLVRLLIRLGVSYQEFESIAKGVFVETVTEDYGKRGRPANISRVASIVGLSRKEVSRIREFGVPRAWYPDSQMSPINRVIHFWLHDSDFAYAPTEPKRLPLYGDESFEALVRRHAGDVPVGAVRSELESRGAMIVDEFSQCTLVARFLRFSQDRGDLIQYVFFSMRNLLETVEFNSRDSSLNGTEDDVDRTEKRFERTVWTNKLDAQGAAAFRLWLKEHGQEFLQEANAFIGAREQRDTETSIDCPVIGVGMYFYQQDSDA